MASPKIPEGLQAFLRHADSLHPSNNARRENGFAKEFQQLKDMSSKLKKDPEYSTHHGELEYNRPKNRYKDILPFDHNRIILPSFPGKPGSDYINGNYVKGADGKIDYLALQGPLPRTVDDFWRVIASHKCQIVIMVCREIEMGKLKCKRYWPENKDEILNFAGLEISLISEEDIAEGFVMRTINMKSSKEEMIVTQLQYTAWPDHDVPRSATPLIELNKTLRAIQGNRRHQLLVHCSAGCGRTGTICAVDYAWSLLKMQKTSNFSVYNIVADLRRQRMAMVQTKEQYALVYKAVVQLVQEELDKERMKSHTYVNVEIPASPQSPPGQGEYENCDFLNSVSRWRQNDLQNGSVPKASAPLPSPKEAKSNSKPPPANKPKLLSKPDGAAVAKATAQTKGNYVNLEFPSEVIKNKPGSPVRESVAPFSAQPSPAHRTNVPSLNLNAAQGGSKSPVEVKQKSPTNPDYEIVPKKTSPSPVSSPGSEMPPQKKKVSSSDYEFPAISRKHDDKKQSAHVPEGLLIDLGDDVPPLPSKRHSVGSVTKDGVGSRYENIEVKPSFPAGFSPLRSASSPNVLDDSWMLGGSCLQPTVKNSPQGVRQENVKENMDKKGFNTVPSRMHADSGPKRCPLTEELFQDPGVSAGGDGGTGGFEVKNSQSGQYCLLGVASPPSPSKVMASPQFGAQPNIGLQLQKQKSVDEDRNSPHPQPQPPPQQRKQNEQSKARPPVGAYALVGIPEIGNKDTKPSPVPIPAPYKSDHPKGNTAIPVKDKGSGFPVEAKDKPIAEPSYELVGQWQAPGKMVSPPPMQQHKPENTSLDKGSGCPVEVKEKPIAEPSYELVGQWQAPGKMVSPPPMQQHKPENTSLDVKKDTKGEIHRSPLLNRVDKQHLVAKINSTPDISLRGQADGEAHPVLDATVGPDLYATVVPRTRDKTDTKDRNSDNLSSGSPNLHPQTSSGSLRSFTSTSSDEAESPPVVPEKTNEAFLVPGEEPYEAVQQSNKGTLGRFKKMVKSSTKGSLPKRLSDITHPTGPSTGASKTNSLGTVVVPWEDIGYKKRVEKPTGPRPCPAQWPSFGHLGL